MNTKSFNIYFFSLLGFVIVAVGLRPSTVGSDTLGYVVYYTRLLNTPLPDFGYEYLFSVISRTMAFFAFPTPFFLGFLSFINCLSFVILGKLLITQLHGAIKLHKLLLLLFFFLCISPFFFAVQANVLRQGLAINVIFIFYMLLLNKARLFSLALAVFVSLGFHATSIMYLFFGPLVYVSYTTVFRLAIGGFFVYVLGVGRYLIHHYAFVIYDKIIQYGVASNYKQGIRYDFALFSLGVGLLFHILNKYLLKETEQKRFSSLLQIYWLLTLPFFLLGFGPYSDRYLLPAWVYISVLAAVFSGLFLKRFNFSILWYYIGSFLSAVYFILKIQGIIV